jgi:DNA-binding GntR family transcriptional regulator
VTEGPTAKDALLASAIIALRGRIAAHAPGTRLPGFRALSASTGLPQWAVSAALRHLADEGLVTTRAAGQGHRVLDPRELSGQQKALVRRVRELITSGQYQPAQALPTEVLAMKVGCTSMQARRALHHLAVSTGLVSRDENGPHGPGFYVTSRAPRPAARR